jgi:hypothetical protein
MAVDNYLFTVIHTQPACIHFKWVYSTRMAKPKKGTDEGQEVVVITPTEVSAHNLAAVMTEEASKRALITKYISSHMKSGVDFGTIRFGNKESKPSLFKPGSEKFLSLFRLTAKFEKDTDTWEMAGSEPGVFAYKCVLVTSKGDVVGEGRGVSKLTEKAGWTINNAVKIAEKRAQIDAVLRTGALSDFFTQDLEDMAQGYDKSPVQDDVLPTVHMDDHEAPPKLDIPKTVTAQRQRIMALLMSRGVDTTDAKAIKAYVADETQLELVEANFAEIIRILS